jgi:hypothetical protein
MTLQIAAKAVGNSPLATQLEMGVAAQAKELFAVKIYCQKSLLYVSDKL